MNICFVITELGGGGAERVVSVLSNSFVKSGNKVDVICTTANPNRTYQLSDDINCHFISDDKKTNLVKKIYKTRRILKKSKCEVVISFFPTSFFISYFAKFGLKIFSVFSERSSPFDSPKSKFKRLLRFFSVLFSNAVVFQSEEAEKYFRKNRLLKNKLSKIIGNPINFSLLPSATFQNKCIIAAGRLVPQKNYGCLLRAFAIFHCRRSDYKLKICGNGPLLHELEVFSQNLGIFDFVNFIPYTSEIWQEMSSSSIYALSSLYEGLPNSLLEAEGIGLPVVTTDFRPGNSRGIVSCGFNGEIAKNNDPVDLANCLFKVANNLDFYKEGAMVWKSKMFSLYNLNVVSTQWVGFLKEVLNMKGKNK